MFLSSRLSGIPRPAAPRVSGTCGEQTQTPHRFYRLATHRYPSEMLGDAARPPGKDLDLWHCRKMLAKSHDRCHLVVESVSYNAAIHSHRGE